MENFRCAMLLSAVGDAIGYKNWEWESNPDGSAIMKELEGLGGLGAISLDPETWPVSDDTIMHMATARALCDKGKKKDELYSEMASCYVEALETASTRRPDPALIQGCASLHPGKVLGWHSPFNPRGTGFGAASKAMCIGLVHWKPTQQKELIRIAVESGRMTHNHPLAGFTGAVCTAIFTSYILQSKPIVCWGRNLLEALNEVKVYCKKTIRNNFEYKQYWNYFETKWEMYLLERGILNDGDDVVKFPAKYDTEARDKIYKSWSSEGRAGRRGHDAPMIAYDALMVAQQSNGNKWQELCYHAMIHGGESDTTGCIAGFWYGLMYGLEGIPHGHYEHIEFKKELEELAKRLYELSR
uniref:Inactive ADP-ribosyltransferase ARH2 n=1 Tax=Ciona savignyi TaxID=51511 RepID=H2ZHG8_CIOSA